MVNIANGVGTLDISDHTAQTVNLSLADTAPGGPFGFNVASTQDVIFAHGAANKFVIINPTDGTVDAAITVTVQLQDQYGNIITTGADKDKDVTLNADGAATGDGLVNIANGVGTKDISDHVAETVNLTLTDSQEATLRFNVASTQNVVFAHGAATKWVIINPTDGTVDAAITVTVQLQDQYNNIVTTGDDKDKDVTLNTDGAATGDGTVNIANGVGTLDISDHTAQTVNLSLADTVPGDLLVSMSLPLRMSSLAGGSATHLHVTGITDPVAAGATSNVTVTAKDQYNNTATGYLGTIHFHLQRRGVSTVLPEDYTLTGRRSRRENLCRWCHADHRR